MRLSLLLAVLLVAILFTAGVIKADEDRDIKLLIDKLIKENDVMVFSKSYCPYCSRAKNLLKKLQVKRLDVLELDHLADGFEIQSELSERSGQRTVPSIWIKGKFFGGSSDLLEAHQNGSLQKLFEQGDVEFTDFKDEL